MTFERFRANRSRLRGAFSEQFPEVFGEAWLGRVGARVIRLSVELPSQRPMAAKPAAQKNDPRRTPDVVIVVAQPASKDGPHQRPRGLRML
jgi:hypothetical protein